MKLKSLTYFLLLASYFLLLAGCGGHKKQVKLGPEEIFRTSKQYFDKKKYGKAINGFKKVIFEHPGSHWTEQAQYYLAKSCFLSKDYINAEMEYDFFIRSFPESRFTDDAYFELAVSYYKESPPYYLDQSLLKKAYEKFETFELKYPDSKWQPEAEKYKQKCIDRFVKKELATAKLYIKLGRPKPATIYLEDILNKYPENSFKEEIEELLSGL